MGALRHRHILLLPFALIVLVMVVGGVLNTVDARGRLLDDMTDKGIPDGSVTHGANSTTTDENGEFVLPGVPRTSRLSINARGYQVTSAPVTQEQIRLEALSLTVYAWEEGAIREKGAPHPQARLENRILSTGNESGQMVIAPHPGHLTKLFICASGYQSKEIEAEGVLMEITLEPGGEGCPPLPTPSPSPGASPPPEPSPTSSP